MSVSSREQLAIFGGRPGIVDPHDEVFSWPVVTDEDEQAVLDVLRARNMSGIDITRKFEAEWGEYLGTRYNLGFCNGTASLLAAMFGVGLGRGDEMIAPSLTYWASALPAMMLGATPVFADVDPQSLTIAPADVERKITEQTRAILVVHYCGHPCDMDAIMALARKHNIKVIEDVSHAQGGEYHGRKAGAIGDVAGISMMGTKSFAIGEGGMLSTNDQTIYERAVAFAHYERIGGIQDASLRRVTDPDHFVTGLPLGACKGRLNQTCAAMGRVQLRYYPERITEIQRAMNRFWDLLGDVPGLRAHRTDTLSGSTMGGWFNPIGHYVPEELNGLPVARFVEAVQAEGGRSGRGVNFPLHLHPVVNDADIFRDGKPTRIAFAKRDVRQPAGALPVTEALRDRALGIPYFKKDVPDVIEQYAAVYRKVAMHADELAQQFIG